MKDLNANELLKDLAKGLDSYLTEQNIKKPIFIGIQTGIDDNPLISVLKQPQIDMVQSKWQRGAKPVHTFGDLYQFTEFLAGLVAIRIMKIPFSFWIHGRSQRQAARRLQTKRADAT